MFIQHIDLFLWLFGALSTFFLFLSVKLPFAFGLIKHLPFSTRKLIHSVVEGGLWVSGAVFIYHALILFLIYVF